MIERIPFDRFANTAVQYRDHFFCPQKSSQNQYLDVCIIVHTYIIVVVTSSGILKAKQNLGITFNFDKLGGIAFAKISKLTMCSA